MMSKYKKKKAEKSGRTIITAKDASELNQIVTDLVEGVAEEKE